jgi:hypothetical protein
MVTHPKYPTVTSEVTTVSDIVLDGVDTSSISITSFALERIYVYHFQDLPEDNFYIAAFERPYSDWDSDDTLYTEGLVYSNDAGVEKVNSAISADKTIMPQLLFKDELFQNAYKNFEMRESTNLFMDSIKTGFTFTLANVSEDTYKYYKSIPSNDASNPFTDPVKVHSNINGGFGIFGSISYSIVTK